MSKTDAESLEQLKVWRDNLKTALQAPETVSAYGGMPDKSGGNKVLRMAGRAQLLSELREVEARIESLQGAQPYLGESRGVN